MEFKRYRQTEWEFTQQGKAQYKGIANTVKNNQVFIGGRYIPLPIILQELFPIQEKQKEINKVSTAPANSKLEHGNKGRKLDANHIKAIKDKNSKPIEVNGVKYKGINHAAEQLQVSRHTISRYLKRKA